MAPAKSGSNSNSNSNSNANSSFEYRFEDSPALRHGCAVCKTSLNNPRAKLTCFGKHAEPCVRFHQTMFRMGCSHKCEPCRNSLEQHDKRHREIGTLVREIQEMDSNGSSYSGLEGDGEGDDDWVDVDASLDDLLRQSNDKCHSSPSSLPSNSSPSPLLRKSKAKMTRNKSNAARHAKQLARVVKRKQRPVSPALTAEFIEKIQLAIHEYSAAAFSTADRERVNQALLKDIQIERQIQRQENHHRHHHLAKNQKTAAAALEIGHIRNVMSSLGIEPPTPATVGREPKERRSLLEKLGNAIKVDIETVANEARETMKRQTSYYRYADRRRYNAMVRNKQLFNWQTGEELAELALNASDEQGDEAVLQEENGNKQNGHADLDSPRVATTAEASQKEESTTCTNNHENDLSDLVLRRSPGTLIFSLTPAEKSPDEVNSAADSDSPEGQPEVPEPQNLSPVQETKENQENQKTRQSQETVRIEPIITHMKRQPGRKKKAQKRKPLLEKKNSLNAKKKKKSPESSPTRGRTSSSSSKENTDDGHEEESTEVPVQEDQKVSEVQPAQSELETQDITTAAAPAAAAVETEILEEDTKESPDTESATAAKYSLVQQPSDIEKDETDSPVKIKPARRRRVHRMLLKLRPRVNWEAMFVKWASKMPDPRRVLVDG